LGAGEALAVGLVLAPDARNHLLVYLLLFAASSLLALIAARSLSGSRPMFLIICAGVLRLTLLFRPPDLSDDIYRYIWDARVAAAGISPYAYAPADRELGIISERPARLTHSDVRTVYPPVAQAAFRAGRLIGRDALPLKALFAAADLSIVPLILALGGPGAGFGAALYAFHPLATTESAAEGHLDSLGIALLLATLVTLAGKRRVRAGVAFALSVLTKYVPAVAAIALVRRGRLPFAAAFLATGTAIWLVATRGGPSPASGLLVYASRWEFNSVLYPAAAALFAEGDAPARAKTVYIDLKEHLGNPSWMQRLFPFFYADFFARMALAAVLAAVLLVIAWHARDDEGAVFASLAALLLASPTLHPWYLLWILPFAARRREPAFLYLSFAAPLAYALLYPVGWLPWRLVYTLEYAPFAALVGMNWIRRRPLVPARGGQGEEAV
jgi:hypothetical protein